MRAAVARLGIDYPVLIDSELELWQEYENEGWPARYLFDGRARLFEYHYGEGAYAETELAIQELLGVEREPLEPLRPEDAPDARLVAQTEDQPGAYSGPYEAGGVWAVLDGVGNRARQSGEAETAGAAASSRSTHPGAYPLIEHERHTAGVLELEIGAGRAMPGDLLHAGLGLASATLAGASSACVRSSSRRFNARADRSSSTSTQRPGPVGALAGAAARGRRVVRPAARVHQRAPRQRPRHSDSLSPGSGPARWVWPKIT